MKNIDTLYKQWQDLHPLKAEDKKRLDQKFMLEFNYNSNHIEGNTLTYGQTKLLLMFDETSGSASLKDYEEMKAHNVGLEMIKQYAKESERPLTESFIRELNKTILVKNYWIDAKTPEGQPTRMEVNVGEYKSRPNSVVTATGEVFEYAKPEETHGLMTDLVRWFNEEVEKGELTAVELASLFHYRYIRIHPFEDGNGRISRLLVNYILHKFDYPMIIVKSEDKANYLRALHQSDINCGLLPSDGANATIEDIAPFLEYMKKQLEYSLAISIRAAKGESIEEVGDWQKKLKLKQNSLITTPIFTDEFELEIITKSIMPLVDSITNALKEFETFFTETVVRINGAPNLNEVEAVGELYDVEGDLMRDITFELSYYNWNILNNNNLDILIQCDFDDRKYTLNISLNGKEMGVSKKYNQYLEKEDVDTIINFVGNEFADFVSTNIVVDNE